VSEPENRPDDDQEIRRLVRRLSRPHRSGGRVIERASLMAEGADFEAVMAWIEAHGGSAEAPAPSRAARGLHSERMAENAAEQMPLRFVLPADAVPAEDVSPE
jgi:hypothetical protein